MIFEDTVQCYIFTTTVINSWKQRCEDICNLIKTLAADYIWHKDEFNVCIPMIKQPDLPDHLFGLTCFGDNIEDEWFIVYLLLEISKKFKDLVIQITDCDGDFLLIEAANYLPTWANPENTENRVFLHNGSIHIIPPSLLEIDANFSVKDAIKTMSLNSDVTLAPPDIQKAILQRIGNYPDKIKENLHQAIVNLPLNIASLLKLKPSLISALVTTYCHHDPIDVKHCKDLKYENTVPVELKFTKCLYAMIMHSNLIKIRMNNINANDKKNSLGLKLTSGYHMIIKQNSGDISESKEFARFIDSLNKNGYFKNNIEGSKDHKALLDAAKEYFKNIECPNNISVYTSIMDVMSTQNFCKMKESLATMDSSSELFEDSDDWLNIDSEDLNELLEDRYGRKIKDKLKPETMTLQLNNFLQQTSDLDGIEPSERENWQEDSQIDFDSNEFVNSLQKMLNLISNNDEEDVDSEICSDTDEDEQLSNELDREVSAKLVKDGNLEDKATILHNLVQSVKEEGSMSGPTSNLLQSIGITKDEMLDSDDD